MAMEGDAVSTPMVYVRSTQQRMARAIDDLTATGRSGRRDLSGPIERLRIQQAASRRAGCVPIVHLCQAVDDCLALESQAAIGRSGEPRSDLRVAALLLDACWTIRLYADAVEKTAEYAARQDGAADPCSGELNLNSRPPD